MRCLEFLALAFGQSALYSVAAAAAAAAAATAAGPAPCRTLWTAGGQQGNEEIALLSLISPHQVSHLVGHTPLPFGGQRRKEIGRFTLTRLHDEGDEVGSRHADDAVGLNQRQQRPRAVGVELQLRHRSVSRQLKVTHGHTGVEHSRRPRRRPFPAAGSR